MTRHHHLSPSSAERWTTCTAAPAYEATLAVEPENLFADEGTAAHALAAEMLGIWQGMPPNGDSARCRGYVQADPQWALPVLDYVDYVRGLPGVLHIEVRCSLDPWVPGGFGTADAVTWHSPTNTLYVTDLKFGRGVRVDATNNPQLRLYALGAVKTLCCRPDTVVMTIHQPRLDHVSQERIRYTELLDWAVSTITPAVAAIDSGRTTYRPSEKACRWCRGRAVCSARAIVMLELAKESFR